MPKNVLASFENKMIKRDVSLMKKDVCLLQTGDNILKKSE